MKSKVSNRWPKRTVENFFDSWSENMAYVLGFLAADGTIYKNKRGSYYIAFTSTDEELIVQMKKLMRVSNKIETYQSNKEWRLRYTLQIGSKKIFARLVSLGFTPNKSLTLKFPQIPDELLGHFLRGYFDGDGSASFTFYKRKNRSDLQKVFNIRLRCGSKTFIEALQKKLTPVAGVDRGRLYFHSLAYDLVYNNKDVVKLYSFMYPSNQVPCLERKKRILKEGIRSYGLEV